MGQTASAGEACLNGSVCSVCSPILRPDGPGGQAARAREETFSDRRAFLYFPSRLTPTLLDLMLPKMDGYKICRLLKRDTRYTKIPIILFTARAQESDEKMGYECGADAYPKKPFNSQELLEKIKTFLIKSPSVPQEP